MVHPPGDKTAGPMPRAASPSVIGLIAGNGRLPHLFARAVRKRGQRVMAVAHRGETDPALAAEVDSLEWVRVGQVARIASLLKRAGVERAVMAGGIGKVRALREARPDFGALRVLLKLSRFGDDELLRAVAAFFEDEGIRVVSPTEWLEDALAPEGLLAGPEPTDGQKRDVALGVEVARAMGRADVGQTVVVKGGSVMAVEAIEGTDEAIRRGGTLAGPGAVVVKMVKPGQDERFDLPAVGPSTLQTMASVGAKVLAVEAGRTLVLDAAEVARRAGRSAISVLGVR